MKAVLLALSLLVTADYVLNAGETTRHFMANVVDFGQAIGAWVYYPAG